MPDTNMNINNDTLQVFLHYPPAPTRETNYTLWIMGVALLLVALYLLRQKIKRRFRLKSYDIKTPFFGISGSVLYTTLEQEVAWKIYIELVTRVTTQGLKKNTGIYREALTSLYTAFSAFRTILKDAGPELIKSKQQATRRQNTVLSILLNVMNDNIRPFLSQWHPVLEAYEKQKADGVSQYAHEQVWPQKEDFETELKNLQIGLSNYLDTLKSIAVD